MEFEGTITFIGEESLIGEKQTPKVSFVVEEISDRQYKSSVCIDLFGEKTPLIKDFKVGDTVKASLNFRAREYNGRRFNSIGAWKLEGQGSGGNSGGSSNKAKPADDDLPF